jgi:prostaglandin E receptor 4
VGGQPLCDYFSFMMIWAGMATVLVVGGMTLERVLAILLPYFYERHVTAGKVKVGVAVIWVVSALFSCLPLINVSLIL